MASQPITLMLKEFAAGDKTALDRIVPHIYTELQRLADRQLKNERNGHTLQPTALVHEAYARMWGSEQPDYSSRAHFLGMAARVMRQILIDHARIRTAGKRGGGQLTCSLEGWMDYSMERPPAVIAVDDAIEALARTDPGKARLVEMRFFGGMTAEESAAYLGLPVEKVRADLRVAQAWLKRELHRQPPPSK